MRKADPSPPRQARAHGLGARIRELRKARAWLLSDLADRSGIAVSTLSKVENEVLSLTYDRLQAMAGAFGLSLSEFLAPRDAAENLAPSARISWARKGSGATLETHAYLYNYLCQDLRVRAMTPILSRCMARTLDDFGPLLRHEGEEFILVLRGPVTVHTEYYAPERLEPGEGVYLDSRMGHAYLNASDGDAWILSINQGGD